MGDYVQLNNLRVRATDHNLVSASPVYCQTSPTTRIEITQNHLKYQQDLGAGYIDIPPDPYFPDLSPADQTCVNTQLHTLLDPFYTLLYPSRSATCIHPDDILERVNNVHAIEFTIHNIQSRTNVMLYWRNVLI